MKFPCGNVRGARRGLNLMIGRAQENQNIQCNGPANIHKLNYEHLRVKSKRKLSKSNETGQYNYKLLQTITNPAVLSPWQSSPTHKWKNVRWQKLSFKNRPIQLLPSGQKRQSPLCRKKNIYIKSFDPVAIKYISIKKKDTSFHIY